MLHIQKCFPLLKNEELETQWKKYFQFKELEERKWRLLLEYKKTKKNFIANSVQVLGQ